MNRVYEYFFLAQQSQPLRHSKDLEVLVNISLASLDVKKFRYLTKFLILSVINFLVQPTFETICINTMTRLSHQHIQNQKTFTKLKLSKERRIMVAGMDFRSHISLLIVLFGILGLFTFTTEAAIKKYQFDVRYIYIYGQSQHVQLYN